ncbi:MAG: hypothetical protein KC417_05080, partial [Myxococcales bacterium]|nr:hypothetical protein [Myxococcales bacterium]
MQRCVTAVGVAIVLAGCVEAAPEVLEGRVALGFAPGCRPAGALESVRVTALGDFAPREDAVEVLDGKPGAVRLDGLPSTSTAVSVLALAEGGSWRAGATAAYHYPEGAERALLLPLARSCPLGDPGATVEPGAVAVALPAGGAMVTGGLVDGLASRRSWYVAPGETLATVNAEGLADRRAGATISVVDGRVCVLGGVAGDAGPAHDTFEMFELGAKGPSAAERGSFCRGDAECVGRVDHGAVDLGRGRLLVVGGRAEAAGTPLDSAFVLDVRSGAVDTGIAPLPNARASAAVVRLDDGTVLVVGGAGTGGGATGTVYAYDELARSFDEALDADGDALGVAPRTSGVAVPLEGARFAWFAGDGSAADRRTVSVYTRLAPDAGVPVFRRTDLDGVLPVALAGARGVALGGSSLLVIGFDGSDARAFVVDVGAASARETEASRAAAMVLGLADGAVLEINADGASLRRESLAHPLDAPPSSYLPGGASDLAFDAEGHWDASGDTVVAKADGARALVPVLRFGRVRVEMDADAGAEL